MSQPLSSLLVQTVAPSHGGLWRRREGEPAGEMLGLRDEEEGQWGEGVAFWQQQTIRPAQLLTRPQC